MATTRLSCTIRAESAVRARITAISYRIRVTPQRHGGLSALSVQAVCNGHIHAHHLSAAQQDLRLKAEKAKSQKTKSPKKDPDKDLQEAI